MVRSDRASAGVIFTLDPDTGHRGVIFVTSSWGLGESVVQGRVAPDQFVVHKATLREGFAPLVWKKIGTKEVRLVYDDDGHKQVKTERVSDADRARFSLSDADVLQLARWAEKVEAHYSRRRGADVPMDLEWAKDGVTGELFIVQARPETVHSRRSHPKIRLYSLKGSARPLVQGLAIGDGVVHGQVRVLRDPRQADQLKPGEIPSRRSRIRLGAGHEDGSRDHHRSRRAHLARSDRRTRAWRAGDRRDERRDEQAHGWCRGHPLMC